MRAGSGVVLLISSVTKPSHSGSNGVTLTMIPQRAYVDFPTHIVSTLRGMRKYSTERPRAKEFGGTMQTVAFEFDERFGVEMFGIDDRGIHVREDAKFVGHAYVVTIGGNTVADHAVAYLAIFERLDHLVLASHRRIQWSDFTDIEFLQESTKGRLILTARPKQRLNHRGDQLKGVGHLITCHDA